MTYEDIVFDYNNRALDDRPWDMISDRERVEFVLRMSLADKGEKPAPVAYRIETDYEQPFYLYSDTLPTRGKWDALYTTTQPCPECDEKQSAIDVWEGRYADKTAECEKLKAKIDLTNTLAQQSNQDHLNVRKDYQGEIINLKAERDELAAQVEKMREALIAISIAWSSNEIYSQHFFNAALAAIDALEGE